MDLSLGEIELRINIAFMVLVGPYTFVRRIFRLLFGRQKAYRIFLDAGLPSTMDFLGKLKVPKMARVWIEVRTRFAFEREVMRVVLRIRGKLFLDVGSGVGYYSALLSKNFESVMAFEPHPQTLEWLRLTIAAGRLLNVTTLDKAVSDIDGTTLLHIHKIGGRHSIDATFGGQALPVQAVKIDSIVNGKVDLVKVDVEGAEWRVIRGAEDSIIDGRILRWVIEVHDERDRQKFEYYLRQRKYETRWLGDRHLFATLAPIGNDGRLSGRGYQLMPSFKKNSRAGALRLDCLDAGDIFSLVPLPSSPANSRTLSAA